MELISAEEIELAVASALAEDIGSGDVTTLAAVPETSQAQALMRAREPLVVAGLALAEAAFRQLSTAVQVIRAAEDGQRLAEGKALLKIIGPARALLGAERVALNFLQRLCGVATLTAQFVEAVKGSGVQILDTRKTTPGWRRFEKYAVTCGGGRNHRFGLYDMVLIKDNHLAALRNESPNAIAAAIQRARAKYPALKVEVEADSLEQVEQAVAAGADIVLLDNMNVETMRKAVVLIAGRTKIEASGNITLERLRDVAATGVDYISIGALTHSVSAMDISQRIED